MVAVVFVNEGYATTVYRLVNLGGRNYSTSMTPTELIKHYGSQVKTAKALGVSRAAVQKWVKQGRIPPVRYWHVMATVQGWKPL